MTLNKFIEQVSHCRDNHDKDVDMVFKLLHLYDDGQTVTLEGPNPRQELLKLGHTSIEFEACQCHWFVTRTS